MRRAILHLKRNDPVIKGVIERVGPYRLELRPADFTTLVRSIIYQQVSGKAAATIMGRLEGAVRQRLTPHAVLKLSDERMREVGLSRQKAAYLRDLAEHSRSGALDYAGLEGAADEEVIERLTVVKGIGVWTAQMFLIFALGRPDVLPTTDLGIRAAMKNQYGLDELPKPAEMERLAEPWRPWCSVACWYLWRSLDGAAAL